MGGVPHVPLGGTLSETSPLSKENFLFFSSSLKRSGGGVPHVPLGGTLSETSPLSKKIFFSFGSLPSVQCVKSARHTCIHDTHTA